MIFMIFFGLKFALFKIMATFVAEIIIIQNKNFLKRYSYGCKIL